MRYFELIPDGDHYHWATPELNAPTAYPSTMERGDFVKLFNRDGVMSVYEIVARMYTPWTADNGDVYVEYDYYVVEGYPGGIKIS